MVEATGTAPSGNGLLQGSQVPLTSMSLDQFSSGKTIINYYGLNTSSDYFMTTNIVWANDVATSDTRQIDGGDPAVETLNIDFDVTFDLPQIIDGVVIINLPVKAVSADADDMFIQPTCELIHWDGATETSLGTITGDTNSGSLDTYKMHVIHITVARKKFKIGETLRLTVTIDTDRRNAVDDANVTTSIGHDPKNREESPFGTGEDSQLKVDVPFNLTL